MLALTPSVQSPRAYDLQNLTAAQLGTRLAAGANATLRDNIRTALQDSDYRYRIHPAETAAGLVAANLTFGYDPGNVLRYGAVGDDATDNAAAFVTAKAVAQSFSSIYGTPIGLVFPDGIYRVSASQNWFLRGIELFAHGKVVIKATFGSGYIWGFDAGTVTLGYRCRMIGDFILDGGTENPGTGFYTRNVNHCHFECEVRNVSSVAFNVEGCVLNRYKIVCSSAGNPMTVAPANGLIVDGTPLNSATTACWFECVIEHTTDDGVVLVASDNNTFTGTSEGLPGKGVVIGTDAIGNLFTQFFCEENADNDFYIAGRGNRFVNCTASSAAAEPPLESMRSILMTADAQGNIWEGGYFYAAQVTAGALDNGFINFESGFEVTDAGTRTAVYGKQPNISATTRAAALPIQDAFTALVTVNGWANTSGTYYSAAYAINRASKEVVLRGEVGGGALGSIITTLPVGARPAKQVTFYCADPAGGAHAVVAVQNDGTVEHISGAVASIDLGMIRFFV